MIRKILQSISSFPLVSGRTNEQFYSDMEAFVVHGANTTVNEQNQLKTEMNNTVDDINDVLDIISNNSNQIANDKITISQAVVNALAAKDAAIAAKDLASTIYDNFDDRYLDTHATAPTVDNDGNALRSGALYYNSTNSKMYVYDAIGLKWVDMMYIPTLLSSLSDIVFGSKANNDVIQYDSATGKWVNRSFYSKAELDAFIDIHSKTEKASLADTDEVAVASSTDGFSIKKISWANIKTLLSSIFIKKIVSPIAGALTKINADGSLGNSNIIEKATKNILIGTDIDNGADLLQLNGTSKFKNPPRYSALPVFLSVNMNNLSYEGGIYCVDNSGTNFPLVDFGIVEVLFYHQLWVLQRFTCMGYTNTAYAGRTFTRMLINGTTWTAWRELSN